MRKTPPPLYGWDGATCVARPEISSDGHRRCPKPRTGAGNSVVRGFIGLGARNNPTHRSLRWSSVDCCTLHRLFAFVGNNPINQTSVVFRLGNCLQTGLLYRLDKSDCHAQRYDDGPLAHALHSGIASCVDEGSARITLPAQPVGATPSSALIRECFRGRTVYLAVLGQIVARAAFLLV